MWYPRVAARVPEDATLDEFLPDADERQGDADERSGDGEDGGDEHGGDAAEAGVGEGANEAASVRADDGAAEGVDAETAGEGEAAGPEPAVSTHRFHPDGRACADCGGDATRLWRDGDALVCADCKQWRG